MKADKIVIYITDWLKNYLEKSGTNGFVVGISGGIDSAVTSTLCAMTGAKVVLLKMPIHQAADQDKRGKEHIDQLMQKYPGASEKNLDLTTAYDVFIKSLEHSVQIGDAIDLKMLTYGNTRSRLRMAALYAVAGIKGLLVCGTGNKVEDFGVGFFTKYGDGGVDISPIADLTKTEVYELGRYLNIVPSILDARPTDGLWDDDRTDEDQIGATYAELERAMALHEREGDNPDSSEFKTKREKEVWDIYIKRHKANLHKINPIPVCLIPDSLKT